MADPNDYVLVRMDSHIADGAVLTYDNSRDMITDSGLTASQGGIQSKASTVSVGIHDVSSAGEQVSFRNQVSGVNYAPPWHVIDETNPGGSYDRYYEPLQSVTRFADRSSVLENPSFQVHIPVHEVVYSLNITFPEAVHNVVLEVMNSEGQMWREIISTNQGPSDYFLKNPIAFHPGDYRFNVRPYGDINLEPPVKVMGNSKTGEMGYDVTFREFSDKKLATEEYVIATVTGGPADDVMLKSVYDTNGNGKVDWSDWATKVQGVNSAANSSYYGKDSGGSIGFHALPDGIDEDALKASIKKAQDQADTNKAEIDKHETAIEGHGTQLATHANSIATNTKNIKIAMDHSKSALDESGVVRKNGVNAIVAEVSNTHKTITLKLMSQAGLVDAALIDLSSWFPSGPTPQPGNDFAIYYGFSVNPPLAEAEILRLGTMKEVSTVDSLDITLTRTSQTPSYMWVWLPDSAGTIKGFDFSGFVSVWQSTAVSVAGVDGKFFVSPKETSATSIEFEVRV